MKRLTMIIVVFSTFAFGFAIDRMTYLVRKPSPEVASKPLPILEVNPVRVRIPQIKEAANNRVPYDHYYAIVENMSSKPVSKYVLGFGTEISNVGARGFMSANGFGYTYAETGQEALSLGETRMIPIKATAEFSEEAFAWVDYVEFTDGSTWGANRSCTKPLK